MFFKVTLLRNTDLPRSFSFLKGLSRSNMTIEKQKMFFKMTLLGNTDLPRSFSFWFLKRALTMITK